MNEFVESYLVYSCIIITKAKTNKYITGCHQGELSEVLNS